MNFSKNLALATVLAPALVIGVANAAQPGLYLGAGVGQANMDKDSDDLDYKGNNDFKISDEDTAWKAYLGYNFLPWLGVEAGYVDFGDFRKDVNGSKLRVDANGWDAFVVASLPLGPVDLFAKVGGIALTNDVNASQFGSDSDSDTQLAYGAGIAYNVGRFSFRVEAEGFDDNEVDDFYLVTAGVTYRLSADKPAPVAAAPVPAPEPEQCPDGDGDGVCDSVDQCPDTPRGTEVESMGCNCHYSLNLEFAFDSAELSINDMVQLDALVPILKNPKISFISGKIDGYTDSTGSESYNMGLSKRRADSVYKYLESKGVNLGSRFTTQGYGEADPVASNDTEEGRAQNRRVVLRRTDCK